MEIRISELMNLYQDDSVRLAAGPVQDAERIKDLTMKKLGISPKHKARRLGRTLLIAAAAVLLLMSAALAAYHLTLGDRVAEDTRLEFVEQPGDEPAEIRLESREVVGVNGAAESPESQTWAEWQAWKAAWLAENFNWYNDRGLDDSYTETPDNYAYIYAAPLQEQAEALDAIAEKYGLQLLQKRQRVETTEALYAWLGTEAFLPESMDVGGFLYNNGSMNMDGSVSDRKNLGCYLAINAQNSFLNVGGLSLDYLGEGEAWSYETKSGVTVDCILFDTRAMILADFESAAMTLTVYRGRVGDGIRTVAEEFSSLYTIDRAGLEELADAFALDVLAERYAAPFDISEALDMPPAAPEEEEPAAMVSEYGEINEWIEPWESDAAQDALVLEALGLYEPAVLPEGMVSWFTASDLGGDAENGRIWKCWMLPEDLDTKTDYDMMLRYEPVEHFKSFNIIATDEMGEISEAEILTGWPAAKKMMTVLASAGCVPEVQTIQGWEGVKTVREDGTIEGLLWYDEDAELVFWMINNLPDMSADEFLAMAESMEAQ